MGFGKRPRCQEAQPKVANPAPLGPRAGQSLSSSSFTKAEASRRAVGTVSIAQQACSS